jgi:glycosyltransferase involved in cell wall biosynthesis
MRPEAAIYHSDAKTISARAMVMPLLTCSLALLFLKFMVSRPSEFLHVAATLLQSRNLGILIKNLLVLPKAIWIAQQVKTKGIEHIHAYWASTSATAAMVASYLTGVAWSITCYRGDIGDNNLLALKHQSAKFIRCPDEQSREEIVAICKLQNRDKLHLIRSGVRTPSLTCSSATAENTFKRPFCFAVPALMVEKKGHVYLLEAVRLLADKGYVFACWLIGDGPLQEMIEERIRQLELTTIVEMKGLLPLEEMKNIYRANHVDAVVLPSIVTADNQKEGIPVSLIDALSYGVPVISTLTGGIPELVTPEVGILVAPRDSTELARSMEYLMTHHEVRRQMSVAARRRTETDFDVVGVVSSICHQMQSSISHETSR